MGVKCPKCDALVEHGTDYPKLLELAEADKLRFECVRCGFNWMPAPVAQKTFAENLRRLVIEP